MDTDWLQDLLDEVRRHPPHPGESIRHDCLGCHLDASEAAHRLGVSRAHLMRVLDGHAPVTPSLACKLEAAGWSNAKFWLRLQGTYDQAQRRQRIKAQAATTLPASAPSAS